MQQHPPSGPSIPKQTNEKSPSQIQPNLPDYNVFPSEIKEKMWWEISYQGFCNEINGIYDKISLKCHLAKPGRILSEN